METSILFCIKDPIPFVVIGGTSGIGKTSILDFLLDKYADYFEQPASYTSRPKRDESDRYIFVTKEEMINLNERDEFINFDEVHGNYYGIKKDEISRIKMLNKIPIKEIHPTNFHKFANKCYNTVSVIIESKHDNQNTIPLIQRNDRPQEDFTDSICDFKLNVCNLSIEDSAQYLVKKLISHKIHISLFPHLNLIDKINKEGYQEIAKEFDDDKRITTKNFHDTSKIFWEEIFSNLKAESNVLELGYGNGWLLKTFGNNIGSMYGVDISENMNSTLFEKTFKTSSRNIPVKSNHFDFVFGSLIDPLISLETFAEAERLLKHNGVLAFTIPAKEWAINLPTRKNINETTFVKENGEKINVFSFCNAVEMLPYVVQILGFKIQSVRSYCLPQNYIQTVSPAVINAAENCNKEYTKLPLITAIILKKTHG